MRKHHRIEQHAQMWCFAHDHYDLFEQRFDSGFARGEAETLEQTAHLDFDIAPKVDQLGACRQQRMLYRLSMLLTFASRYQPIRASSARPRASLRSVLLTRIDNAARACRASRQ